MRNLRPQFTRTLMSYHTTEELCKYFKITISCCSHGERDEGKGLGNATVISVLICSSWRGGNRDKIWCICSPCWPYTENSPTTLSPQTSKWLVEILNFTVWVFINCQQFLKATTAIPSPTGHYVPSFPCIFKMEIGPNQCTVAVTTNYYFTWVL